MQDNFDLYDKIEVYIGLFIYTYNLIFVTDKIVSHIGKVLPFFGECRD